MSDLVGNPEDRFSRVAAQLRQLTSTQYTFNCYSELGRLTNLKIGLTDEPVHEKTNNLGFRPGPTQTRLNSHSLKLEALDIRRRGIALSACGKQRR